MASLDLSHYRILLIDDVEFSRRTVAKLLAGLGNPKLDTAENGAEALKILQAVPDIDIVISDFRMPAMDGLQLLQAVRTGEAGVDRALPFAILTGYSDRDLVDRALALDVSAFLVKPVSRTRLESRLKNMITAPGGGISVKPTRAYHAVELQPPPADDDDAAASQEAAQTAAEAAAAGKKALAEQAESVAKVVRSLNCLNRRYDTDLAQDILMRMWQLLPDVGEAPATALINCLDRQVEAGNLAASDLPTILTRGPKEGPHPMRDAPLPERQTVTAQVSGETTDGFFLPAALLPDSGGLLRDLHDRDEVLLLPAGTRLTGQVSGLLQHLDSVGALELDYADGVYGLYVSAADSDIAAKRDTDAHPLAGAAEKNMSLEDVLPGDMLARDIYTANGTRYAKEGVALTEQMIGVLRDLGKLGRVSETIWISG